MSIVKDAFVEGRETEVDWGNSKAKKNDLKMNIAVSNMERQLDRKMFDKIQLARICPETGKVLQIYLSRLDAARWICKYVLKREDRNPVSVTGNMEMCRVAGWKSYGYYWKILENSVPSSKNIPSAQKVYGRLLNSEFVFDSITEAANYINGMTGGNLTPNALRKRLTPQNGPIYVSISERRTMVLERYNEQKKVLTFESYSEARRKLKVGIKELKNRKLSLNNCEIKIVKPVRKPK